MIENLELKGYNRFFLNNIQYINYTPLSQIQLILGSNGSGKSSLLKELNPLPINKHEFKEDGYKTITITKDNNTYVIKSSVTRNSFKVNDEELNKGGTKKVQLNLIYDHFRLTPKSNNVLLNISKLTNMSTNERKDWLRQMSTVDYSYSIFLYNDLKQRYRDSVGFIKIINNELTHDTSIVDNDNDIKKIQEEITYLKEEIEYLTGKYKNIDTVHKKINNNYDLVTKFNILISKGIHFLDKENIQHKIIETETVLKDIKIEMERIKVEIDGLDNYTKTTEEITLLREELNSYTKYFEDIKTKVKEPVIAPEEAEELFSLYQDKDTEINNIILEIAYFDDIVVSKELVEKLITNKNKCRDELTVITKKLNTYQGEYKNLMDNFKEDNKIKCHNCGTESYFGYTKDNQIKIEKKISELEEVLKDKDKIYIELEEEYGKVEKKINLIKLLKEIYLEIGLTKYWNLKLKDVIGGLTSQQLFFINHTIKHELTTFKDYNIKFKRYSEITYKIKLDIDIVEAHKKHIDISKDKMVNRIIELQEIKREKEKYLLEQNNVLIEYNNFLSIQEIFKKDLETYSNNKSISVNNNKNQIIKETIKRLKSVLINLEDKYNSFDRIKNRIEKNKELIKTHEHRKKVLDMTIKTLSPTEGLIAKSINSFINKFLLEMNTIINSVWSYDITLLPCKVSEDNDLDYMFSVLVDNNQLIDDVSMLSSSMKDIVDLSFRIVFMKYMHLTHMPLILDEFGITMDDKHRYNVYNVIENTLANNFEQVFITAHFKSMYSRFLNSDIVVLDDKNLDLDKTSYNTNIKIK